MVSGTAISRTSGSVGCANVVSPPPPLCRVPPRPCQPPTPPPASPRVLIWRRRTESSRSTVVGFAFFGFLSVLASAVLGACSVVAAAGAASATFWSACFCSASRRSRSCFSQLGSLQLGELLLATRLLFAQLQLVNIDARCGCRRRRSLRRDRGGRHLGGIALHEDALLPHLDLHRAVLAGGIGLADLAGLLAGQRDLVLGLDRAVRAAQVFQQPGLVLV